MVKINFIILILLGWVSGLQGQVLTVSDSIMFSGVIIDAENSQSLPNVTCRYGNFRGVISDEDGCFRIRTARGDSVRFTYVGYKPITVVISDSLREEEYMLGIFMSPDTLLLSEALIIRRWGASRQQNLINARNNMAGILKQAYSPVRNMDADMNQKMVINEYARGIEMKGHVDVRAGVGTQSIEAYKKLRMQKRVKEKKEWLNPGEIDLLKKLYYLEKKKKQDN